MNIPINWNDDNAIKRFFTWSARVGLGPLYGSRPIAWYQMHHCEAHDYLVKRIGSGPVKVRKGRIISGACDYGPVSDAYQAIDYKIRK